jgi:hypothetical protein
VQIERRSFRTASGNCSRIQLLGFLSLSAPKAVVCVGLPCHLSRHSWPPGASNDMRPQFGCGFWRPETNFGVHPTCRLTRMVLEKLFFS